MKRSSWFFFGIVGTIWGIPYLLIKVAVTENGSTPFTPALVVFSRVFIGAILLISYSLYKGTFTSAIPYMRWIIPYAIVEMVIPWWLISSSETKVNSGLAGLLVATVAFWTTLLAAALGDRSVWLPKRLTGLVIGFVGLILVVGIESLQGKQPILAIIALLVAAFGYALAPTLVTLKMPNVDGAAVNGLALLIAAIIYAPIAVIQFPKHRPSVHAIESVIALGIFPTAICFVLFFKLLADVGPARASLVVYVNTTVAVLLGVIVLHEKLTIGVILGLPLVMIGSYFATRKESAVTTP
jgi:drug/metabolite transporter (DMT)-like permease